MASHSHPNAILASEAKPHLPSSVPARDRRLAGGVHPMVATKLWHNPCTLSFRANFIAHHFNLPIYDWIERAYAVGAAEHVVLYALGLRQGITAEDIVASSSRPKNTLSRAVNTLVRRRMITRRTDPVDRRRRLLYLTARGSRIVDETVPALVAREQAMLAALTPAERRTLHLLLTRIILNQPNWSAHPAKEPT